MTQNKNRQLDNLVNLPDGYVKVLVTVNDIPGLMSLRQSVGWNPVDEQTWADCIEKSLSVVGVKFIETEALVGIGFLAGNARHAVLCDLTVHPDHQHKGIGRFLTTFRIEVAEQQRVPYLYISLASKNPLRSLYEELGFVSSGNEYFRARNF